MRAHRSTHMDIAQEPCCAVIYRENAGPGILCKPTQSKRRWTVHKNPFRSFSVATVFGEIMQCHVIQYDMMLSIRNNRNSVI